jgi:hypothetical protein
MAGDERVIELPRMLSCHPVSEVAHVHARELLGSSIAVPIIPAFVRWRCPVFRHPGPALRRGN